MNALGIVVAFVLFAPDLANLITPTLTFHGAWNVLARAQLLRLGRQS